MTGSFFFGVLFGLVVGVIVYKVYQSYTRSRQGQSDE